MAYAGASSTRRPSATLENMDLGAGAVAFVMAMLLSSSAFALEDDGSPRGPLGAVHPEAAFTVMAGPALPQYQGYGPGPMGGGPGVRAGASLDGFYVGLAYVDFLSQGGSVDVGDISDSGSTHGVSVGADVGYGRTFFERLIVRGLVNVSDYVAMSDGQTATCTATFSSCTTTDWHHVSHNMYLQPAILVEVTLGPVLVGADTSFLYMPRGTVPGTSISSPFAALMLGVQLGARL
jgi:hypothetical protein